MGIPATEYVLAGTLQEAIDTIKADLTILNDIFPAVDDDILVKIKALFQSAEFSVSIGYPTNWVGTPTYVILLDEEEEEDIYIGSSEQYSGLLDSDLIPVTDELIYNSAPANINLLYLANYPVTTNNFDIKVDGVSLTTNDYLLTAQSGVIILNVLLSGTEHITASYSYYPHYTGTGNTNMNSNYKIECWYENAEAVVWLFNIAKYWLLLSRTDLAVNYGLLTQRLSATGLEPIAEYYPQRVFRRQLILTTETKHTWTNRYDILRNIYVTHADGTQDNLRPGNAT